MTEQTQAPAAEKAPARFGRYATEAAPALLHNIIRHLGISQEDKDALHQQVCDLHPNSVPEASDQEKAARAARLAALRAELAATEAQG